MSLTGQYIRATYFIGLREVVQAAGGDYEGLLSLVDISPDDDKIIDKLLPFASASTIGEIAATQTGVNDIGLRLTKINEPHFANLGPVLFLARFCKTVRDWEALAREYWDLHSNSFSFVLIENTEPGLSTLRFELVGLGVPLRQHTEHTLSTLVGVLRAICNRPEEGPVRVSFRHQLLGSGDTMRRYMTCPVTYAARHNEIVFRSEILDYPTSGELQFFRGLLRNFVQSRFDRLSFQDNSVETHVRLAIASLLGSGKTDVKYTAELLGQHPKSLQRQLADKGLSYSDILEDVRKQMAMQLLSHSKAPIANIAGLLGYASAPPFILAFKRWTGQAPFQWRAGIAATSNSAQET